MTVLRMLVLAGLSVALSNAAFAQDGGEGAAQVEGIALDDVDTPVEEVDSEAEESDEADAQAKADAEREFGRELLAVEEDVSALKERVFRSKATLQLLKELVIEGATVGSRVSIFHINKLGGSYSMEAVKYFLNGKNVFTKVEPGGTLDTIREIKIHEQTVPPGTHNLQLQMTLRGKGSRLFAYLRTYQFNVQSSYAFRVEDGKVTVIRVIAESKGGLRNFVERPTISYDERTDSLREE